MWSDMIGGYILKKRPGCIGKDRNNTGYNIVRKKEKHFFTSSGQLGHNVIESGRRVWGGKLFKIG